jgi:hypothetical protein
MRPVKDHYDLKRCNKMSGWSGIAYGDLPASPTLDHHEGFGVDFNINRYDEVELTEIRMYDMKGRTILIDASKLNERNFFRLDAFVREQMKDELSERGM